MSDLTRPSKATACAQCRISKTKCNRPFPCNPCKQRGLATKCPDGALPSKATRTEILIGNIGVPPEVEDSPPTVEELDTTRAFGALMIGDEENSQFFGVTSCIEWMMLYDTENPQSSLNTTHNMQTVASSEARGHFMVVDSSSMSSPPLLNLIDIPEWTLRVRTGLPERQLAERLVDAYYGQAAWESCPVPRARFFNEFLFPCFANSESPAMSKLAFIYSIFGIGALHLPDLSSHNDLAQQYITFSEACLKIDDSFTNTNVAVIDTLILHVIYYLTVEDSIADSPNFSRTGPYPASETRAWVTLGIAMKLATSIGLHREPSMWGELSSDEVNMRRRTMWELLNLDLWACLMHGRPTMLSRQHFDVELPVDDSELSDADTNFYTKKYSFSGKCLWDVVNLTLASPHQTNYAAVGDLNTKISQWIKEYESTIKQKTFMSTTQMIYCEIALICLHRHHFALALLEEEFDVAKSPYANSVISAYQSACIILTHTRTLYEADPAKIMRFGLFWTHAFSSAVILAAIVIRAPRCQLAPSALNELNLAVEMYKTAQAGYRARRGLATLIHFQTSAHDFMQGTRSRDIAADRVMLRKLGALGPIMHRKQRSEVQDQFQGLPVATAPADFAPSLYAYPRFGGLGDQMESQVYGPSRDEFLNELWPGLGPHGI